jgi:uncharacterized membrane protein
VARLTPTPPWSATGLALALVGYASALTPTLVPRTTTVQVVATALAMVTGYAVGAVVGAVARLLRRAWRRHRRGREASADRPEQPAAGAGGSTSRALLWFLVGCAVLVAVTPLAMGWQVDQAAAAGWEVPSWWVVALLSPPLAVALLLLGRAVRAASRGVGGWIGRLIPSRAVSLVLGAVVVAGAVLGLLVVGWLRLEDRFVALDASTDGQQPPASGLRTGGPGSTLEWTGLGRQGRDFVAQGPDASDISGFTGEPALDPIRVYAGLGHGATPEGRAAAAVAELRRTGGLERERVVLVVTSGLGSVHPVAATVLEYAASGDVATVATSFTALPSWMTIVVDRDGARREAAALIDAVGAAVRELPPDERPKLYLYGESLGAYGSQQVLADETPQQVAERFDGVLWAGSPAASPARRDWPDGGPAWEPTVGDGSIARFAALPERVPVEDESWGPRRILFLQTPTDPVAYFETGLLDDPPEWLAGERGPLVPTHMTWWPLLTFQQLLMDLTTNGIVPPGIGHNYAHAHAAGWVAVMQPEGWTLADADRLNEYRKTVADPLPHDGS